MAETESQEKARPPILSRMTGLLDWIAGLMVIGLLIWQLAVVLLRYVFSLGAPWASDLLTYFFFFVVILPLLGVLVGNASVRVDVASSAFGPAAAALVDRIALLLFAFAIGWAAWSSLPSTLNSWQLLERSPNVGGLPGYFVLKSFVTGTFAALSVTALVMALRSRPYGEGGGA
jgi:TRAP-type mannitol/chloroaromatic compound transport system permease small subunit